MTKNETTTDGMSYIWLYHDVCMVNERLKFFVCLTDVLPQSKKHYKLLQRVILLPAVGL